MLLHAIAHVCVKMKTNKDDQRRHAASQSYTCTLDAKQILSVDDVCFTLHVQYMRAPIRARLPTARECLCIWIEEEENDDEKKNFIHFLDRHERTKRFTLYKYVVCFIEPFARRPTAKKVERKSKIRAVRLFISIHPRFVFVCAAFSRYSFHLCPSFLLFTICRLSMSKLPYTFRSHTKVFVEPQKAKERKRKKKTTTTRNKLK